MNEQEKPSGRPTDYEEKTNSLKNAKEQDAVKKKRLQGNPDGRQGKETTFAKRYYFENEKKSMTV